MVSYLLFSKEDKRLAVIKRDTPTFSYLDFVIDKKQRKLQ